MKNVAHMGIAVLQNRWTDIRQNRISYTMTQFPGEKMQMYKLTVMQSTHELSVIFVYINKTPTLTEVKVVGKLLKKENANFILGDFNIDRNNEDGGKKINELAKILNMRQVNKESTRNAAVLDLIFIEKEGKETDLMEFVFENLYSDHSTIGFRYCRNGIIDESFKEMKITEQDKDFLKKATMDEEKEIAKDDIQNVKPRIINEDEEIKKLGMRKKHDKKQRPKARNLNIRNEEDNPIVFKCRVDEVRSSSLRKLLTNEWIDSSVINSYLYMIAAEFSHVLAIDTQFNESLRNKTFRLIDRQFPRETNIFDYSVWIIPVNCENLHWFLITIDLNLIHEKKIHITIFDSMGKDQTWKKILEEEKIKGFIQWKYNKTYQTKDAVLLFTIEDCFSIIPQQNNGVDCGIFTIMYAKYTAAKETFTFSQHDMQRFRKMISEEIMKGELQQIEMINESDLEFTKNYFKPKNESMRSIPKHTPAQSGDKLKKPLGPKCTGSKETKDCAKIDGWNKRGSENQQKNTNNRSETVKQKMNADLGSLKVLKFVNPGGTNLCFSNAIMTLLMNIKAIRDIINGTTQLFYENLILQSLRRIYQKQNLTVTSTQNLRRVVEEECLGSNQIRIFNNNDQCDAAEFLQSLLEHLLIDDPHVSRNLFGQTMETIYCMNANCNAADNKPSSDVVILTLPIVAPTLSMCLERYLGEAELERDCPHCGCKQASQITSFTQDPGILIFQLKRFDAQGNKITKEVSVPSRLNLPSGTLYQIIGSANHYGQTVHSGHYTSSIYEKDTGKFFLINDEHQEELNSLHQIIPGISPSCNPAPLTTTVYVIVYERQ